MNIRTLIVGEHVRMAYKLITAITMCNSVIFIILFTYSYVYMYKYMCVNAYNVFLYFSRVYILRFK